MLKLPETLSEQEFLQLLKATKQINHKLAFLLGFYQGMRISEIVSLNPMNVDKGQKLIRIKQAKGKKDRNIPIMPQTMRYLRHLPITIKARALETAFKKSLKRAEINKDLHFHSLRHSCATWLLNVKKWDIRHVQQFLGHSRLDATQIYTHVSPQNLIDLAWEGYTT